MFRFVQPSPVNTWDRRQANQKPSATVRHLPSSTYPNVSIAPILVVDDERAIREVIAELLELEGYTVEQATNGAEALDRIADPPPSLVLLDMRMPVLDGWGVARVLNERGVNVPIVVLTAAKDAQKWAAEIGAAGHLAKPFEATDLLAEVDKFRDRSRDL